MVADILDHRWQIRHHLADIRDASVAFAYASFTWHLDPTGHKQKEVPPWDLFCRQQQTNSDGTGATYTIPRLPITNP